MQTPPNYVPLTVDTIADRLVNRRRLSGMAQVLDVTRKLGRQLNESWELTP